jgi:hypothetical protein
MASGDKFEENLKQEIVVYPNLKRPIACGNTG